MRGVPVLAAVALAVLVLTPGLASPAGTRGTVQTRTADALLAAPAGLDDAFAWRVDVPPGASVTVVASGTATSLFLLRHHRDGEAPDPASDRAGSRASVTLPGPGAWRLVLDPLAGGAPFHVDLLFTGHYGDVERGAAEFTLTDLRAGHPCLASPSTGCLP